MAQIRIIGDRIEMGHSVGGWTLVGLVVRNTDEHAIVDDFKRRLEQAVEVGSLLSSLEDNIRTQSVGGWVSLDAVCEAIADMTE